MRANAHRARDGEDGGNLASAKVGAGMRMCGGMCLGYVKRMHWACIGGESVVVSGVPGMLRGRLKGGLVQRAEGGGSVHP